MVVAVEEAGAEAVGCELAANGIGTRRRWGEGCDHHGQAGFAAK